jgi:hypothetical protein
MQIDIPQYITVEIGWRVGKCVAGVYIGGTEVFEYDAEDIANGDYSDEYIRMEAASAFGRMLKLKIGD